MQAYQYENITFIESRSPIISLSADVTPKKLAYLFEKRAIDIIGALCGLIMLSPFLLLVTFAVKVTSSGPALFSQTRVGYRGRRFTFLKFRTMEQGCDDTIHREYVNKLIKGEIKNSKKNSSGKPLYKISDDNRVTKIGAFLRTWSIDELPQLINVLKGEMSLVGPRPAIPYEVESYNAWHLQRLDALPGITGLWQIKGRSRTTFDGMVRMDVQYVRNCSFLFDLQILFQTVKVVLNRDGAV